MKPLLCFAVTICFAHIIPLQAQSLSPQVYASSGAHFTSGSAQLSSTIGEPLTASYSAGSYMITQGFHQPDQGTSGVNEMETSIFSVYPNPAQDIITISLSDGSISKYTLDLIDQFGQIIETNILSGVNHELDVSFLAAGAYHLRFTYLQNKTNSFTLIKTSNQ